MLSSALASVLRWEFAGLLLLLLPSAALWSRISTDTADGATVRGAVASAALAGAAVFALTVAAVPRASAYFLRRGLSGKDRGKTGTPGGAIEMCVC